MNKSKFFIILLSAIDNIVVALIKMLQKKFHKSLHTFESNCGHFYPYNTNITKYIYILISQLSPL